MEQFVLDQQHAPSYLPSGKHWQLVWQDEFDGDTLDRSKWNFRRHLLQQPHPTFTDEGATLDGNSNLLLALIEKDGQYYSPHLQTGYNYFDRPGERHGQSKFTWPIARFQEHQFLHRFGYYEIRCKLQTQPGWWSAFWLQSPTIGASPDPVRTGVEIDIMENFKRDGEVTSGLIWGGYGPDSKGAGRIRYKVEETEDGYHYFGLDWSPNGYVFYADGKETCRIDGPVSEVEQFILVTTECMGYRNGDQPDEQLRQATLPDFFTVDHVRVFDEVPK
ncbi:MAG: glycoside hydrolase family 16 protein [Bacillota bacterium]|nr:glycoside hydrolase family 16 protein [Bacillota bacterium]